MTLRQFQRLFRTEKACAERLFELRWPNGYRCPKCNHDRYSFHSARKLYQCGKCKYQVSVTAGTIFHKTRTPLVHWFWMIFIMTRQKSGVSMLSLQSMLGISSYKTVWTMAHKIRKAMADQDARFELKGLVETVHTFLGSGKSASKRLKDRARTSIIVSVEDRGDGAGFATIRHAPAYELGRSKVAIGEASVMKETGDGELQSQRDHSSLNPPDLSNPVVSSHRKSKRPKWARILAANLTGNLRGVHHGVSEKHLHRYLAEFSYRFNRRGSLSTLVNRTLWACVSASTVTFAELTL